MFAGFAMAVRIVSPLVPGVDSAAAAAAAAAVVVQEDH